MRIEKIWSEINDKQDSDLSAMLQSTKLSRLSSNNPLLKIKRNMLYNLILSAMICLLYVAIIFYFRMWQVQLAIGIVLAFSLWALKVTYGQYKKLDTNTSISRSVLDELKRHHSSITYWMKSVQKVALYIYPVSAAGGFMLGGALGSDKPIALFMSKPIMLITLLVVIAVLVPICYFLSKWMSNYSFGKHLKTLGENIHALEDEK